MSEPAAITVKQIEGLIALGRFDDALPLCQKLVKQEPQVGESWFWLGQVQLLRGELTAAESALRQAIKLDASAANSWTDLSLVVLGLGRPREAEESARRAIALDSSKDFVWMNLGSALFQQERWAEAAEAYRNAVSRGPSNPATWSNLGLAELRQERFEEAQAALERSLSIAPNPETAFTYSLVLVRRGLVLQAAHILRQVVEQVPSMVNAWLAWGDLQGMLGDPMQAERAYRRILEMEPGHRQALVNLALALARQFRLSEAGMAAREVIAANPADAEGWLALASVQQAAGKIPEAVESFRQSFEAAPSHTGHSSWLMALQYAEDVEPTSLLAAHREWDHHFGQSSATARSPIGPQGEPGRKLRIGFLSANFDRHPLAFLFLPVLEHLDRSQCTVVLYYDRFDEDFFTARFKAAADEWRVVRALSDEELTSLIQRDQIDVLIDLMGHTGLRLPVFARKPAAVQATWLGYVGTTGLSAIDYLIADRHHVRPGEESWYQETVLRLPNSYAVYGPPPYMPVVNSLPAKTNGWFTFGSLSNPAKFSPPLLAAWVAILKRTKHSRLLLSFAGLSEKDIQEPIRQYFVERGIATDRLLFSGTGTHPEFLARYREIDLALDTQPYSGGVTTCEALWMGVPVVTCPGGTFAGRHATSYLSTVGLTNFVAADLAAYVDVAVRWTERVEELSDLRATLRERVSRSPIADFNQFADDFVRLLMTASEALSR